MSETVLVVPRAGLKVRDLDDPAKHLPPGGTPKRLTTLWSRAEKRGDVEFRPVEKTAPVKTDKGKE